MLEIDRILELYTCPAKYKYTRQGKEPRSISETTIYLSSMKTACTELAEEVFNKVDKPDSPRKIWNRVGGRSLAPLPKRSSKDSLLVRGIGILLKWHDLLKDSYIKSLGTRLTVSINDTKLYMDVPVIIEGEERDIYIVLMEELSYSVRDPYKYTLSPLYSFMRTTGVDWIKFYLYVTRTQLPTIARAREVDKRYLKSLIDNSKLPDELLYPRYSSHCEVCKHRRICEYEHEPRQRNIYVPERKQTEDPDSK